MDQTHDHTRNDFAVPAARLQSVLESAEGVSNALAEFQQAVAALLAEVDPPATPAAVSAGVHDDTSAVDVGGEATDDSPETPAAADTVPESVDLEKWLIDREITVKQHRRDNPFDESFDRLATFLGKHFDNLRNFYAALKQRVAGSPYPRTLTLKKASPQQVNNTVAFGRDLLRNGFLKDFRYVKSQRLIVFEPQTDGRVTNFFTGGWLERYVMLTTIQHLTQSNPSVSVTTLLNPQVVLPDAQDFELDVLIGQLSSVLWFECKTGKDYPGFVAKYGAVAKRFMDLPSTHAALVLLEELTPEEKRNNSHLAGMSVLNLADLPEFLACINPATAEPGMASTSDLRTTNGVSDKRLQKVGRAGRAHSAAQTSPNKPVPSGVRDEHVVLVSRYRTVLRQANLRPLAPDQRRQIIQDLQDYAGPASTKMPMRELVRRLKERYDSEGTPISKSMINDVSRALICSGVCQRGSHPDYKSDVWYFDPDLDTEDLFQSCARLYVWSLLRHSASASSQDFNARAAAAMIWGESINDEGARTKIESIFDYLIASGRCLKQESQGQVTLRAVGEFYAE